MRFYRTANGQWFATQAEARAAARDAGTTFAAIDVPTDKPGLLAWLRAQPRRAAGDQAAAVPQAAPPSISPADYAERTIALDTAFAAAPLAQRLTLAALAIEDARAALPALPPSPAAPTAPLPPTPARPGIPQPRPEGAPDA